MIVIRNFEPRDLSRVYEIERESFKDPYHVLFLMNLYDLYPEGFFVAEKNGVVMGYVISRQEGSSGHVLAIAVDPRARGTGIGTALMQRVMDLFLSLGLTDVWLEVRLSNLNAIKFYKDLGFVESRIMVGYYSDGESAVVLEKKLNEERIT